MAENIGVLVYAEVKEGKIAGVAKEALGVGTKLAKAAGGSVSAVILGQNTEALAKELVASGADTVYTVEDPSLSIYQPDAYLQVLQEAIKKASPKIILLGHTDSVRDLAPKLAFRTGAGLTMDAVELSVEGGKLITIKPVYGGNARSVFETTTPLQMATIRPKAFEPLTPDTSRKGSVVPLGIKVDPAGLKVRVLEVKKQQSAGLRLEDARVVIAGGRGLGGPEPLKKLDELAKVLGGAVGASRAVCDAGWAPHSQQIGLTGKTVTPDVYVAVAISGASQHMAGCSGAKTIVAINKDKDSNIFKEARFGVVGTWEEVLPAFTEMCRELRGS